MFIRVTGPGPFAGLLTMSLCSIGMISKMFIESIEDLDTKILESLDAAGCTMFQKIRYGILSQLFPDFMSTLIYRFDMNLRDATVLGLVGAGGIGAPLIFAMSAYKWNQDGCNSCRTDRADSDCGDNLHKGPCEADAGITIIRLRVRWNKR